ncbi:Xyloglucanase precursor [compost metagenome]
MNWIRINDDRHQYGDIRSISGDPRVFGRIYVATGTRGLVYGDIDEQEEGLIE